MEFCGAKLHKDNHIGDWGTTFGYIIYALKKTKTTFDENDPRSLAIIEELYKKANAEAKDDPTIQDAVRAETAKMQAGDPENMALWKKILAANMAAMKEVHEIYGISYDTHLGESFYNDKLERVYKELTELGIAKLDDGALVVFHPEHPRFKEQPFIIRKSDGAANYGSTDLATMIYRVEVLDYHNIYIVTDARQSDHFEQLWITTQKWFKGKGYRLPQFHHIQHGAVLGSDGKPFKTRGGESIKLYELFGEAIARATKVVAEKSPELPPEEKKKLAEVIGIGAIRYADISQNRTSDYVFDWNKMLSFDGNTAPYLLYAVARIYSLFEKLGRSPAEEIHAASSFETPNEMALAKKLIQMPTIVELASSDMRPHYIATYLYELSGAFSAFYNTDHIQGQPAEIQNRRLLLAQKTLLVLETGLHLLGLKTVKRM
jgi:arginyl-tRNA synthetase